MKTYDVYGIGNALVDTEYEVTDDFLDITRLPKGMMTLIEERKVCCPLCPGTGVKFITPTRCWKPSWIRTVFLRSCPSMAGLG